MSQEEAIEIINRNCTEGSQLREACAMFIPELKESEDERIREIIRLALIASEDELSDFYKVHNISRKECTDWLEKQKEQKPIRDIISGDAIESCMLRYLQSATNRKDDVEIIEDTMVFKKELLDIIKKEQKPLSTEETELNSIAFLEQMGYTCIPPGAKPAEWSEDKFPKDIEKDATQFCFDKGFNITPYQAKEIAAHYLRIGHNFGYVEGRKNAHIPAKELGLPSSMDFKQEWSDEDEKIRRNLMSLLANMRGDRITEETYQKYYPWLKDLHPSWKPSEEQMQYLLAVINDPNNAGAESCHLILESLYNDLKEL